MTENSWEIKIQLGKPEGVLSCDGRGSLKVLYRVALLAGLREKDDRDMEKTREKDSNLEERGGKMR